jgi:hypothetical protein
MKKTSKIRNKFAVLVYFGIIFFAGCRSVTPPVTFFTLSSIQGAHDPALQASPLRDAVIGVGPAQFPDYLDRPQIVTRSGPNKLDVSEFNRWGGKLDQDFLHVFGENLSILLSTDKVIVFPWKGQINPDYRITLDIHRYEGQMGDSVLLNVTWTIQGKENNTGPLHIRRSIIHQPISGQGFDALASAYSQAVAELSREVASTMISISK